MDGLTQLDGLTQAGADQNLLAPGLPPPAPLPMHRQDFSRPPATPRPAPADGWRMWPRRILVLGGAAIMTMIATVQMQRVFDGAGADASWGGPVAVTSLVLFAMLFAWLALSFTSAAAGFLDFLLGGESQAARAFAAQQDVKEAGRLAEPTALLMPIYNEDPARVFAAITAMRASLLRTGQAHAFAFFVLSDTTDPDVWVAEEAALLELRRQDLPGSAVHYRRRAANQGRKAGNIADWVRRFGAGWPSFVILDADSLIEGETLVRLAAAIERLPDAGLIQTVPLSIGGETPWARLQQFAQSLHGPLIARGFAWWQGSEANYYGHNAIIRTRAFADSAGLPELPGRKPFGGEILSHDFVEAALLRRAGWGVHLLPDAGGSFEEGPPSLPESAVRDRRWCQGNLQHAAILGAAGLHPVSRLHFLSGIGAYITAPLWMLFLVAGMAIALHGQLVVPDYFPSGPALFPRWPVVDPVRAFGLFVATLLLLLAPKVLGLLRFLADREQRLAAGGTARVLAGWVVEVLVSAAMAPIAMLTQSRQIIEILLGRDSGWSSQVRAGHGIRFGRAACLYAGHTLTGAALALGALAMPSLALWLAPIAFGLLLSIPLVWLTAHPGLGRALAGAGLLATPMEASPSPLLRDAQQALSRFQGERREAVARLLDEPFLLQLHLRLLPDPVDADQPALASAMARLRPAETVAEGIALLERGDKARLLGSAVGLRALQALARREISPAA